MAYGSVEEVPPAVLRHMTDVAVTGTAHLAQAALPRFRAQGAGTLVVVNSLLAEIAVPSMGAYCAAKAGMDHFTRCVALEEAGRANGAKVDGELVKIDEDTLMHFVRQAPPTFTH